MNHQPDTPTIANNKIINNTSLSHHQRSIIIPTHSVRIINPTINITLYRLNQSINKPAMMPENVSATVCACMK
jgi:hypothetical protein